MFIIYNKSFRSVFFSYYRKREMRHYVMAICLLLMPLHKAIAQHTNSTAIKAYFTKLENEVNELSGSPNYEQAITTIVNQYFPLVVEDDFNAKHPASTTSAKTIETKEYLEKIRDFGCKVSYQPITSEIDFLKNQQNNPFARVPVLCTFNCSGMSVLPATKIFELSVNENGSIDKILASVFYEDSPKLTKGVKIPTLPKPKPPLVVQTPTPSPTPKPPTTTTPCPPCPKLIPDLCASLPLLGIKQQRRESCKSALLRHLNEFRGRIDCASLGVSPLPGETCSNAIIRHFTEQANCTRMAALQIQKQDNETCAAAIDRHVKELMKRADCDKLLSLGITPKPNENCETMLRRYLEDGKNISLDFKVKQNTGTGSVPFSKVVAEKYADKLSIPILPKPSEQKIEILDSVNTKNLIKLMSDEIADYEAKMEEARTAKVEVYFIANETGRRKKGEKDVRIHLTKDGLTKKEFKKFKSPRVKNIYVMLPLKPVLFPEKSQIPFKIMIQDIVLPETKHLESNPQVIKELYKQVAVGRGFAIPKNSIAKKTDNYSNVPLFIVTYYGEQNLISNANSVSPDKKNEKAYEFYINKHGFYTGKVE